MDLLKAFVVGAVVLFIIMSVVFLILTVIVHFPVGGLLFLAALGFIVASLILGLAITGD